MREELRRLARANGILLEYTDVQGQVRKATEDTVTALLEALNVPVDNLSTEPHAPHANPDWKVVACEAPFEKEFVTDQVWRLQLEDGSTQEGAGPSDFPDLPLGIHSLWIQGKKTVLLAAPKRLCLPKRSWGLMVPLWGLRGAAAGGLGDYGDLRVLANQSGNGPSFIGLNPIHAGFPTDDTAYSPYQPSHRRRLNTLHIPCPGAASTGRLIDYPAEFALRRQTLEAQFADFHGSAEFDAFCKSEGTALTQFARHQALAERYGAYWTDWPTRLQNSAVVEPIDPSRLRFHKWAQWRAETALHAAQEAAKQAGLFHGLYLDLAVGTHPAGAEVWEDPTSFARGVSLGAPPDELGPQGQTWNLAPFHPKALIEKNFEPLADTLRRQFRHCGILRIDHILGFERAFWVPEGGAPGGYVSMPREAMLAVARIEAARANCTVVGEDLGVVPDGLRDALTSSGILGCRVAMFERDGTHFRPPEHYPETSIASFSTHDLPTWSGWRSGRDLKDWAALGAISDDALTAATLARSKDVAQFDQMAGSANPEAISALHQVLARTPARLVAVQAESIAGVEAQPNMPGTVSEYPNWRQRLPIAAQDLPANAAFKETCRIMGAEGR